jgi:hypothetical protein
MSAAKEAGITLSRHFKVIQVRASKGLVKRRIFPVKREADDNEPRRNNEPPSQGSSIKVALRSGAGSMELAVSIDLIELDDDDQKFVFGIIAQLKAYEKQGGAKPPLPPSYTDPDPPLP